MSGINNNADGKNAYTKAGFSIYNIAGTNTDVKAVDTNNMGDVGSTDTGDINAGNINSTEDVGGIGSADNNIDSKNTHAKVCFNI